VEDEVDRAVHRHLHPHLHVPDAALPQARSLVQPYQDLRDRTDVVRLLKAGYHRVALDAAGRPRHRGPALSSSYAPGGLPENLKKTLVESPLLPLQIDSVAAAPTASAGIDYPWPHLLSRRQQRQLCGPPLRARGRGGDCPDFEVLAAASWRARARAPPC